MKKVVFSLRDWLYLDSSFWKFLLVLKALNLIPLAFLAVSLGSPPPLMLLVWQFIGAVVVWTVVGYFYSEGFVFVYGMAGFWLHMRFALAEGYGYSWEVEMLTALAVLSALLAVIYAVHKLAPDHGINRIQVLAVLPALFGLLALAMHGMTS